MGFLDALVPIVASKTTDWIAQQKDLHLPGSRALLPDELSALSSYFSEETLALARISFVDKVPNPPFLAGLIEQLSLFGNRVHFDFSNAAGITFGECVLIADHSLPIDLLFHELVHVVQYQILGIPGFSRAYVRGIVDSGFIYEKIPLEAVAFEMSARFVSAQRFSVSEELPAWLKQMGYTP